MAAWTRDGVAELRGLVNLSVELVQVSVFLAAFSGLYFAVSAVTDETYREQFFTELLDELERAVGVRAVYLALQARDRRPDDPRRRRDSSRRRGLPSPPSGRRSGVEVLLDQGGDRVDRRLVVARRPRRCRRCRRRGS